MSPTMSAATAGSSSGAAQSGEEVFVTINHAGDGRRFGRRVPLIKFERAAKDDPVGPREHVAGSAGERILDLGLRLEEVAVPDGSAYVGKTLDQLPTTPDVRVLVVAYLAVTRRDVQASVV